MANDVINVQLSIESSQEMVEKKNFKIEERTDKKKKINKRLKDKQRDLEDRSHRDNLRFDGVREYENELWNDTEEVLKDFLFEYLGLRNIKIERAHRT